MKLVMPKKSLGSSSMIYPQHIYKYYFIVRSLFSYIYTKHDKYDAPDSFKRMQNEGLSPDAITFFCTLKACGGMGAIDNGKQIHDEVVKRKLLDVVCLRKQEKYWKSFIFKM